MLSSETGRENNTVVEDRRAPRWLWLTVPIAVLATTASVIGILVDDPYAKETANWAAQGIGQDIGDLVAYPTLLALAYVAGVLVISTTSPRWSSQ